MKYREFIIDYIANSCLVLIQVHIPHNPAEHSPLYLCQKYYYISKNDNVLILHPEDHPNHFTVIVVFEYQPAQASSKQTLLIFIILKTPCNSLSLILVKT